MKLAKRITGIVTAAITAISMCGGHMFSGVQPLIVEAETITETLTYDGFNYVKVDEDEDGNYDYVRITSGDELATEISIPSIVEGLYVKSIHPFAFDNCTSLTSINVSANNLFFSSIGGVLFNKNQTEIIKYPAGKSDIAYKIPESVTCIREYAFLTCGNLESITIPEGVTSIGFEAFYYCTKLKSIIIPESVTSIQGYAFTCCESLTSITIPGSVTSIEDGTFYWCTGLKSITIPESVTSIGNEAFYSCESLTSVTIPKSVTSIGNKAFFSCEGLTSIKIPYGVTSIGDFVFRGCIALTSVTIPKSVTSIGYSAFFNCESLTSVTIPESVTSIGKTAFCQCTSLTDITIPENVSSIGEYAFRLCTSLTSINVSENNLFYSSIDGILFNKNQTKLIKYPAGKSDESYVIPKSVINIEEEAFYVCKNLANITITDGVENIGIYAFYHCDGITSIIIPKSVSSIGENAFSCCTGLTDISVSENNLFYSSIDGILFNKNQTELIVYPIGKSSESYVVPESVTSIGNYAFCFCDTLKTVTIPENVTSIKFAAFHRCFGLTGITIENPKCEIYDSASTINDGHNNNSDICYSGTIYGYKDSTAQTYAEKYNYAFDLIENVPAVTTITTTISSEITTTTISTEVTTTMPIVTRTTTTSSEITTTTMPIVTRITTTSSEITTTTTVITTEITTTLPEFVTTVSETISSDITDEGTLTNPTVPTLSKEELEMSCGDKVLLKVENYDGEVKWLSSDDNIVAVDEYGQVTALNEGTAYVMAFIEDMYLTCTVTVSGGIATDFLLGDANLDGKVNVRDCAFIAQALANGKGDELPVNADFNEDEKKNVRDAAALASYLSKKQ